MIQAVVFDLFGTLVNAPTRRERARAAHRLSAKMSCEPDRVDRYFGNTWRIRHDGTLASVAAFASHLVGVIGADTPAVKTVSIELCAIAKDRLEVDPSVVSTLQSLRQMNIRLGILSDASPEIAEAWSQTRIAQLTDGAVFSCTAGLLKPNQDLYRRIRGEMRIQAERVVYVGDGGGDELHGAHTAGMIAVAVRRRGGPDSLVYGASDWTGPILDNVEQLPSYLTGLQ